MVFVKRCVGCQTLAQPPQPEDASQLGRICDRDRYPLASPERLTDLIAMSEENQCHAPKSVLWCFPNG